MTEAASKALAELIAFAKTAPGRLPSRVQEAIAVLSAEPVAVEPIGNFERIGFIHEGDKFIYQQRGKPTDKPVYVRAASPKETP